jgi:hypothetical protein
VGRSIYCSTCKKEKEPGRDNESRCKTCKSIANKEKHAKKREQQGLRPYGSGRSLNCYKCKAIKENPKVGYCNKCERQYDNEWRIKTGRTKKHQTGLCPCGQERAPYSPGYCRECIAKNAKEWRKLHPYTEEQMARRNGLQNKRYKERNEPPELKMDEVNIKRRMKYHDPRYIEERFKIQVRSLTRAYIKSGKLIKQPCEECGEKRNVEAHHDDYSRPFDIRWLCKFHHMEHHRNVSHRT